MTQSAESRKSMIETGPKAASTVFLFAHGAGAPMDSTFMEAVAAGLAGYGIRVVRFEFPYMASRRDGGKKRPPDRQPKLIKTFIEAIETLCSPNTNLFIGGKSMGGRMATLLTADAEITGGNNIQGCVCFGYPFHAPGKPMGDRMDHFSALSRPLLICQGTRDPFGGFEEFATQQMPANARIGWVEDGDHDLKPRKASGRTHAENIDFAIETAANFMKS